MKFRFSQIIFKTIYHLVNILPYKARKIICRMTALLIGRVFRVRRTVARENIKKSFPNLGKNEINSILNDVYLQLSFTLMEFLRTDKLAAGPLEKYVEIKGEDYLKDAFARGQGIIFYTAHFGNWEWLAAVLSKMGYPVTAVARSQSSLLNSEIEKIRQLTGLDLIYREKGAIRKTYRCLQEGKCLLILGDQEAHHKGWKVNFLGRPASAFKGAVQLSARTGAAVIPVFLVRKKLEYHQLIIKPPIFVDRKADPEELHSRLQELTDICGEMITRFKSHWLWLHRRWKSY